MSGHLHHKLATLHQNLLHGKLPRDLRWADVVDLIEEIGEVHLHGGQEFSFAVGARRELFRKPHTPEINVEDVSRLRQFLKLAESESPAASTVERRRMVVVIDHHAAHIFSSLADNSPQEATVTPYDPHHYHHHLVHRKEAHYEGDRVPEDLSFYEQVAAALLSADEIVLVGHGSGKSSAVSVLEAYLHKHHTDLSRRITATEITDLSALTTPQIEAIAKRHMGS